MSASIAVYQLNRKFVNKNEDIPENAKQVVYYALAIGHHVGVIDCFTSLVEIPVEEFSAWLERLPEGAGRQKLAGVLRWGEIEVNRSHVGELLPLLQATLDQKKPASQNGEAQWVPLLIQCLQNILAEPAYYLMLRKRT
ncbi:MAG: formate hydrogenlyase maturation protein HycH [Chloroflexota bacterium]